MGSGVLLPAAARGALALVKLLLAMHEVLRVLLQLLANAGMILQELLEFRLGPWRVLTKRAACLTLIRRGEILGPYFSLTRRDL